MSDPQAILQETAAYFQLKPEDLRKRRGYGDQRALAMELMHRHKWDQAGDVGQRQVSGIVKRAVHAAVEEILADTPTPYGAPPVVS